MKWIFVRSLDCWSSNLIVYKLGIFNVSLCGIQVILISFSVVSSTTGMVGFSVSLSFVVIVQWHIFGFAVYGDI